MAIEAYTFDNEICQTIDDARPSARKEGRVIVQVTCGYAPQGAAKTKRAKVRVTTNPRQKR